MTTNAQNCEHGKVYAKGKWIGKFNLNWCKQYMQIEECNKNKFKHSQWV